MAIERRVKPSARMRDQLARKRLPIIIGAVVLVVVIVGGLAATALLPMFKDSNDTPGLAEDVPGDITDSPGLSSSTTAEKALLAGGTSYTGNWAEDLGGRYSVYLPGTVTVDSKEFASEFVTTNEGLTAAYGVMVSDQVFPSLNNDPTADTSAILSVFLQDITADVSKAMYGVDFSGAYDMSAYELSDGTRVIWLTGDLQTIVVKEDESGNQSAPTEMYFPLSGFIAMKDDTPVFIWGVANPDDGEAVNSLNSNMLECAGVYASAKTLVPTYTSVDEGTN